MSFGVGGNRQTTLSSAASTSHWLRTMAGQVLKYPCTLADGNRLEVITASWNRAATELIVQAASVRDCVLNGDLSLCMTTSKTVESLTDASYQFTLKVVQSLVFGVDHQDVLVTPATLLDCVQVCDFGL